MIIRIRRRSAAEWLVGYIFALPFTFYVLMVVLGVPPIIKYTIDAAWVLLLFLMMTHRIPMPNEESGKLLRLALIFVISTIVGAVINGVSPAYYLWGFRNNMRFYVFFFACILSLKRNHISNYLAVFDNLFWVNLVVTLYQFFVLGKLQDHLGGIFGVEKGCNAYTNIFMLIVVTKSILFYVNKMEWLGLCLLKCAAALLIAALAELKFFFLEIAVVMIMVTFRERFSMRKILIMLGMLIGAVVAIRILAIFAPVFKNWFTLESILKTATNKSGYTGSNDMNRLTAVAMAWDRFLPTAINKILGLGLGSCDYSAAFSFLSTPFYQANSELNYTWFMSAFLILETGAVGLVLYIAFFVSVFRNSVRCGKKYPEINVYVQLAQIMSVLCLLMVVYNSAMRTEAAYMAYFILAIPFLRKERQHRAINQPA